MKELLSKAEIDSLLAHFRSEGAHEELIDARQQSRARRVAGARITPADLFRPTRVPREQIQMLQHIFQDVAARITTSLSQKLRSPTPCDCVATEQLRFASWVSAHAGPVMVLVLEAKPMGSLCVLTVSAGMIHGMVDRALGGSGAIEGGGGEFSDAEVALAETCLEPLIEHLAATLSVLTPTQLQIKSCNGDLDQSRVIPDEDLVVSVHLQVTGQPILGDVKLAIPYTPFEQHLAKAAAGASAPVPPAAPGARAKLERLVRDVKAEISVQLGKAELTLGELLGLRPGDVVRLDHRFGQPVVAPLQGRPRFLGQIGRLGDQLAFRVARVLADENEGRNG